MRKFIHDNSLSIIFFLLFIVSITGQIFTGIAEYNKERQEEGQPTVTMSSYLTSGHFLESTFENWESEFLQMAFFVLFTIWLYQKGSSESKALEEGEEVDREPDPNRKGAPWPVRKGGWVLTLYKHSLTIALLLLFLFSFIMHLYGSHKDENEQLAQKGLPLETLGEYLGTSRFWFESFQNWQSEFLSVFAIIVLSIYLRQIGSSQSKPVDAPHDETGE
jgi:Ca2+/Na+ antiporter